MKAYRCDRCGKFYSNPNPAQEAMEVVDSYGNEKHILVDDWQRDGHVDLCIYCSLDLKSWWDQGKAVKEE